MQHVENELKKMTTNCDEKERELKHYYKSDKDKTKSLSKLESDVKTSLKKYEKAKKYSRELED